MCRGGCERGETGDRTEAEERENGQERDNTETEGDTAVSDSAMVRLWRVVVVVAVLLQRGAPRSLCRVGCKSGERQETDRTVFQC